MVDILLTHSYHLFYDRKQVRKMQPYPPLGTLYAAALLRRHGFSVAVFDTMLNDPEQGFDSALARYRPQLVAIYEDSFNFLSKMCLSRMREVAFAMIRSSTAARIPVVVNGSDASDNAYEYLQRGCECVLLGEAENTLLQVTQALLGPYWPNWDRIPGIAFLRPPDGHMVRTAPRPLLRDLDSMPFPARDLVDLEPYRQAWKSKHGFFSLNLVSSRGCPYRCNWCAKPIYGSAFHIRSAKNVAAEMKLLKDQCGAEHLWFADDIFALKQSWAGELAQEVERLDAALPFKMQSRVDLMTRPTVAALRQAGCAEVWMGAESGSQSVLDAMDKDTRVEQIAAARTQLLHHGIRACYFLQFGYPGETWHDIQRTIELVRRTRPDDIGVSVSYPLPGTAFYAQVVEQLGAKTHWSDSDDLAVMFRAAYTDEFYHALHDVLHAEVETWSRAADASSSRLAEVQQLWERVYSLEKTCRCQNPTRSRREVPITPAAQFAD